MMFLFNLRYPHFLFLTVYEAGRKDDNNVRTLGPGGVLYQSERGLKYVIVGYFWPFERQGLYIRKGIWVGIFVRT